MARITLDKDDAGKHQTEVATHSNSRTWEAGGRAALIWNGKSINGIEMRS
jgi:hypothetical protein